MSLVTMDIAGWLGADHQQAWRRGAHEWNSERHACPNTAAWFLGGTSANAMTLKEATAVPDWHCSLVILIACVITHGPDSHGAPSIFRSARLTSSPHADLFPSVARPDGGPPPWIEGTPLRLALPLFRIIASYPAYRRAASAR